MEFNLTTEAELQKNLEPAYNHAVYLAKTGENKKARKLFLQIIESGPYEGALGQAGDEMWEDSNIQFNKLADLHVNRFRNFWKKFKIAAA